MSRLRVLTILGLVSAILFASAFAQEKKEPPKDPAKEAKKEETKKDDGKKVDPKPVDPKKEDPKVDPKKEDPKVDPKKEDPKKVDPKPAEPMPFAWKFTANQSIFQEMFTKTTQNIKVQGLEVTQVQSQTFWFKWTPKAYNMADDTWQVDQEIEGLKMSIDIAGNPVSFDSTQDSATGANSALSEFFRALKGQKFTLTVNAKTMKVTKVEGRKEFIEKLTKANPQMETLLQKILSEDALKQMTDPSFGMVPEKAPGKDGTWESKTTLGLGPIGTYDNTYKYKHTGKDATNKDLEVISVEMSMTYKPPTDTDASLPFKIKSADLKSGKQDGKIFFNSAKGRLESSEITLKLSGTLTVEISGTTTQVELTQDQTTTVKSGDKSFVPEAPAKKP